VVRRSMNRGLAAGILLYTAMGALSLAESQPALEWQEINGIGFIPRHMHYWWLLRNSRATVGWAVPP
jgi:hypothetical protein